MRNETKLGDLLERFWQRSSDACPLECGEAEKQESAFRKWVKPIESQFVSRWDADNELEDYIEYDRLMRGWNEKDWKAMSKEGKMTLFKNRNLKQQP